VQCTSRLHKIYWKMAAVSLADIPKAVAFAWQVYKLGWDPEHNASKFFYVKLTESPHPYHLNRCFCHDQSLIVGSDQHFISLGNDIKGLAQNLSDILDVVENAQITWKQQTLRSSQLRGASPKEWNLSSLNEIVGDYKTTLEDCDRLLKDHPEFYKDQNFTANIEWNLLVQPKVDSLEKRLEKHNSKILIVLKPLELNLLSDIHHDLAARIDAVHLSVLRLQGLLIPDVEQAISEKSQILANPLTIPANIEERFKTSAEKSRPEIKTRGGFPLQAGADAFISYFEDSTKTFTAGNFISQRTPSLTQYLNLLKCIWIMKQLQENSGLSNVPKDSHWPGYIDQLHENLCNECQRFTSPSAQRLMAPDISAPIDPEEFSIWKEEDIATFLSPLVDTCIRLDEVMRIPLPTPRETLQREMTVSRIEENRYRLAESILDTAGASSKPVTKILDIDLRTVRFTPIYATPSSRLKPLEVLVNTETSQLNPTFKELKHIYRLQHLLTGYKVFQRYDQPMAKVTFMIPGSSTSQEEYGRVQLWIPVPFNGPTNMSPNPSEANNLGLNGTVAGSNVSSVHRWLPGMGRNAMTGSNQSSSSNIAVSTVNRPIVSNGRYLLPQSPPLSPPLSPSGSNSGLNLPSITGEVKKNSSNGSGFGSSYESRFKGSPSLLSNFSTTSRSSISTVKTIKVGKSGIAQLHQKPNKPLLVLFLKSRDQSPKLSIVAIQIDDATSVERQRCDCLSSHSKCRRSCIEREGGMLLAQRWTADDSPGSWNLGKLGVGQRSEKENLWHNIKRVTIKFERWEGTLIEKTG
jgi:hypothetical protein